MVSEYVQFPADNKIDFMRELRKKVDEYFEQTHRSKNANASMIIKTVFMLALYLGPYVLMITGVVSSTPLIFVCWVLMGFGLAGMGMNVMHDANHGSYSKNQRVNRILGSTLYLLGGLPANWRIQHNAIHHAYTNINGFDDDINPTPILRFSPHKKLRKHHKYQFLYGWFLYGLMTVLWITSKDFMQLFNYRKRGVLKKENKSFKLLFAELVFSKILYYAVFLVAPLLILPIPWYLTLVFFFIMHFIAGFLLAVIFQTAHIMPECDYPLPDENGMMKNNWMAHQLSVTSDYAPKNKWVTWFAGGLNYHAIHHLFPNICHIHYKNLSSIVKEVTEKHGVTYRVEPTFFKALDKHARMLKLLGSPGRGVEN